MYNFLKNYVPVSIEKFSDFTIRAIFPLQILILKSNMMQSSCCALIKSFKMSFENIKEVIITKESTFNPNTLFNGD